MFNKFSVLGIDTIDRGIKYDGKQVNNANNDMLVTITKPYREQADLLLNHKTKMLTIEHKVFF